MRKMLSLAAVALAAGLSAGASVAFADDADTTNDNDFGFMTPNTVFDLGVDVSGLPRTAAAVHAYLGSLEPETRVAIVKACENFMAYPSSAQDRETIAFCAIAVSG